MDTRCARLSFAREAQAVHCSNDNRHPITAAGLPPRGTFGSTATAHAGSAGGMGSRLARTSAAEPSTRLNLTASLVPLHEHAVRRRRLDWGRFAGRAGEPVGAECGAWFPVPSPRIEPHLSRRSRGL